MLNVVLVVPDDREKTWRDFHEIAAAAGRQGVKIHLVRHRRTQQLGLLSLWFRPTVSMALVGRTDRKLLPGQFLSGRRLDKIEEYQALEDAGTPVPKWTEVKPDTRLDPNEWGPYVVEKPSRGWLGANVKVRKTSRVQYAHPSSYPSDHLGANAPMIVQQFVYTGEWPVSYRLVSVFGEIVLCYRQTTRRGTPLRTRWGFDEGGVAIVSNTRQMEIVLDADPEMIDVASRSHRAAFPDIPILHFDLGRDAETGRIHIFECHPFIPRWLFSSDRTLSAQADNRVDFDSQFDAMQGIARAIVRKATELL
ncbi:hypothetical protein D3227_16105 [Mesorhizobium waimense]|uniref:ATP-grasp domain-containing protein n=1 Tax=Mesorhizobium waimense TaxID=1300307 RepID=A0A3A5L1A6_9HYPH|nr:hypothetical protein [Mesorhizobium waimense]RJT38780.1 hypothetical protein D3227_16105 [Mesorhizobium waimense]